MDRGIEMLKITAVHSQIDLEIGKVAEGKAEASGDSLSNLARTTVPVVLYSCQSQRPSHHLRKTRIVQCIISCEQCV